MYYYIITCVSLYVQFRLIVGREITTKSSVYFSLLFPLVFYCLMGAVVRKIHTFIQVNIADADDKLFCYHCGCGVN